MSAATSTNPITGLPVTSTGATSSTTTNTGGLSSQDFMNLMITQLQNQDPLNPTDSNALLQQIAEISTLQSNTTLQSSLTAQSLQQSIGAGGNLIGKTVSGLDPSGQQLSGVVTGVQIQNQQVYLSINGNTTDPLPMSNIFTVTPTAANSTTSTTSTTATSPTTTVAQSIINALSAFTGGAQ